MFIRGFKRKTARNITVQVVHSQFLPDGNDKPDSFRRLGSVRSG